MPTFSRGGSKRWQGGASSYDSQIKRIKGVAKILQHEEAHTSIFSGHLPEVVGPVCFDSNDEPPGQMDVSSFGGKSPYEFLPDSRQDNTYPDNDDSSSKCTFIPDDEDAEEDDDFFGLDHFEVEEGMAGFEEGPDEVMPEFTNTRHHQDPRTKTYEERDEPPPAHDAVLTTSGLNSSAPS
jgi:hypothetical protein